VGEGPFAGAPGLEGLYLGGSNPGMGMNYKGSRMLESFS
jgi:hypothetical protein